jgi:lipopolysaccharide biosynthesis regulator YciM
MKKIVYTLIILFIAQFNFAGEIDSILSKARQLGEAKNYTEAIKVYETYIKNSDNENLKDVIVELANCYYLVGKKDIAVKYIKKAITKYGFIEEDFIYNNYLDENLSKYALSKIYDDLEKLQAEYASR